jgi:hypothetical protein
VKYWCGAGVLARETLASKKKVSRISLTQILRLNDFPAADAGSASADMLGGGAHFGVNRTQIYVPAPLAHIVGVADGVSELRPLAANITNSCHNSEFPSRPVAEALILQEYAVFRQVKQLPEMTISG